MQIAIEALPHPVVFLNAARSHRLASAAAADHPGRSPADQQQRAGRRD